MIRTELLWKMRRDYPLVKEKDKMGKSVKTPSVDELFDAVLLLNNREECYRFFQDICTVTELGSLGQRFEVARMLTENRTYLDIAHKTGASTATISRVNRALEYGQDGYQMVIERLKEAKSQTEQENED